MSDVKRTVKVVGAAIIDNGKLFTAQRNHGKFAGYWEFPGGKIEARETPEDALKREIKEELNADIVIKKLLKTFSHDYGSFCVDMQLYQCEFTSDFELIEHADFKWLSADALLSVKWLPADLPIMNEIREILASTPTKFPTIGPEWISQYPWAFAFSTISYENGEVYNFKSANSQENRKLLGEAMNIPSLAWLTLNHGDTVLNIPQDSNDECADAAIISTSGYAAAITTADCLPIVILSPSTKTVAVVHCGWKGLANGILEKTIKMMQTAPSYDATELRAWIGPAVRDDYEIREDVKSELLKGGSVCESNFIPVGTDQFNADMTSIAIQKMIAHDIDPNHISYCQESTISSERFFSVRREGQSTGRLATVVGLV